MTGNIHMKTMQSRSRKAPAPALAAPTHQEISARAEQIWRQRGRPMDADEEIWLEAERQLRLGNSSLTTLKPEGFKSDRLMEELEDHYPNSDGRATTSL